MSYEAAQHEDTGTTEGSESFWQDILRHNKSSVEHWPRAEPALDLNTAKANGEYLLCLLRGSVNDVEQSQWTYFGQLQKQGWDIMNTGHVYPNGSSTYGLGAAYNDPDVNVSPDNLWNLRTTVKNDKTGGEYTTVFTVGPNRGAIISAHNKPGQPAGEEICTCGLTSYICSGGSSERLEAILRNIYQCFNSSSASVSRPMLPMPSLITQWLEKQSVRGLVNRFQPRQTRAKRFLERLMELVSAGCSPSTRLTCESRSYQR